MERARDFEMSLCSDSSAGKEPGASGRAHVSESGTGAPSSLQALLTLTVEAAESLPIWQPLSSSFHTHEGSTGVTPTLQMKGLRRRD